MNQSVYLASAWNCPLVAHMLAAIAAFGKCCDIVYFADKEKEANNLLLLVFPKCLFKTQLPSATGAASKQVFILVSHLCRMVNFDHKVSSLTP